MAEVSASEVMKLRKMSGQGMMDCKKALQEANGDIEEAMGILRKKGLATLAKRGGRETSEGVVVSKISEDGKAAVLASLCCETDFVANSRDFLAAGETLAEYGFACSAEAVAEELADTAVGGRKFSEVVAEIVSKTGEKIEVGEYARYEVGDNGVIGTYVHFNKKVGAMVEIETSDASTAGSEKVAKAANDIAMHIAAAKPLAVDKDGLDSEMVEQERSIFAEQVKNKPAEIVGKIVEGKMRKFYAENCLVDQPFVKDDSKSVSRYLAEVSKQAGGEAEIKGFVRFEVG